LKVSVVLLIGGVA